MPLPTKRSEKEKNYLKKTYLIYGAPKAGKTTITSQLGDDEGNKVLFFATEPGHKFQEIYKWQKEVEYFDEDSTFEDPNCWEDFKLCCRELMTQKHDFKCLVIDTADILYKWCGEHVCKQHGIEHESDLGFGKGYALIREEFMAPINYLAQKGMGLIFVSHEVEKEKDLGIKKISYTDTTLPGSAKKVIHGLCDYIFYFGVNPEGKRYIRTKGTESVNAGDRGGNLSELLPMNAENLINELKGDN